MVAPYEAAIHANRSRSACVFEHMCASPAVAVEVLTLLRGNMRDTLSSHVCCGRCRHALRKLAQGEGVASLTIDLTG